MHKKRETTVNFDDFLPLFYDPNLHIGLDYRSNNPLDSLMTAIT